MERRDFLSLITLAAAAVNLPLPAIGEPLPDVIVEKAAELSGLTSPQIVALQLEQIRCDLPILFEQEDNFFKEITKE